MTPSEEKLFILDLLKLNSSERMYSEETVINIIKQVLKMNKPVEQDTEIDVPKYPTSYRDFTMTEKIDQESIKDTYKNLLNQESNTDNTVQEKQSQTAEEWFEQVSPNDNFGIREKLKRAGLYHLVCMNMERYASQKHHPTDCYPKEFVEWCISSHLARTMDWDGEITGYYNAGICYNTLDELFTYWKENIKQ